MKDYPPVCKVNFHFKYTFYLKKSIKCVHINITFRNKNWITNFFPQNRVEYDAYRTDLELLTQAPRTDTNIARLEEAQQIFQQQKENFEKLKSDVAIKIRFLDENRVSFIKVVIQ